MVLDNETLARWERVRDAALEFGQALVEHVGQIVEEIRPAFERIMEACREAYRGAGMPYGDSDDGMMRWMRERGEIERLRMEAERLEEQHRGMAAFRRMLEERGSTDGEKNDGDNCEGKGVGRAARV